MPSPCTLCFSHATDAVLKLVPQLPLRQKRSSELRTLASSQRATYSCHHKCTALDLTTGVAKSRVAEESLKEKHRRSRSEHGLQTTKHSREGGCNLTCAGGPSRLQSASPAAGTWTGPRAPGGLAGPAGCAPAAAGLHLLPPSETEPAAPPPLACTHPPHTSLRNARID